MHRLSKLLSYHLDWSYLFTCVSCLENSSTIDMFPGAGKMEDLLLILPQSVQAIYVIILRTYRLWHLLDL